MSQTTTEPGLEEIKPIITRIPEQLHRELKTLCASTGVSMQNAVTVAIRQYLAENSRQ